MAEQILPQGTNPLDPALAAKMAEGAAKLQAEQQLPKSLIEQSDLSDRLVIAGMTARPFSAGVIAILELIDSPIFSSDERDTKLADALVLLFILLAPVSEDDLVELAGEGYKEMKKEALRWSFSLRAEKLKCIQSELPELLKKFTSTMELYGNAEDDKKK